VIIFKKVKKTQQTSSISVLLFVIYENIWFIWIETKISKALQSDFKSAFDYAKPVSDISETDFGFSGFLHSIGETETGFAKPLKPGRDMVSVAKPEIVQLLTLNYCCHRR